MASPAISMTIAAATASRRRRSISTRMNETPITRSRQGDDPATPQEASLILFPRLRASRRAERPPRRQGHRHNHSSSRVSSRPTSGEGLDDDPIKNAVEEPALERNQEQASAVPRARSPGVSRLPAVWRCVIADGALNAMQIVENVRPRSETAASRKQAWPARWTNAMVNQPTAISTTMTRRPALAMRRRATISRRFARGSPTAANIAVAAPSAPARSRVAGACSSSGAAPQQQIASCVNRQRAIVDGARRCGAFHRARQPARQRQQRALARHGHDEEHGDHRRLGGGQRPDCRRHPRRRTGARHCRCRRCVAAGPRSTIPRRR